MITATTKDVDKLAAELDNRSNIERWDVYRSAMKKWCVSIHFGGDFRQFSDTSLSNAMQSALAFQILPEIPRQPELIGLSLFSTKKDGSKWQLMYDGKFLCGNIKTKKEALANAEKFVDNNQKAREAWNAEYSWTYGKTEGVDFRYAR